MSLKVKFDAEGEITWKKIIKSIISGGWGQIQILMSFGGPNWQKMQFVKSSNCFLPLLKILIVLYLTIIYNFCFISFPKMHTSSKTWNSAEIHNNNNNIDCSMACLGFAADKNRGPSLKTIFEALFSLHVLLPLRVRRSVVDTFHGGGKAG